MSISLRRNVIWFAMLQGSEYLVPVLAIPFLVRTIGVSSYGKIAFAQAVCAYFVMITEYGFNFTASRDASLLRGEKSLLTELFWDVIGAKALLFSASLLLALGISAIFHESFGSLLLLSMLTAAGSAMYPVWLLQGIERVQTAAKLVVAVRLAFLIGIYVLVKSPGDLNLAALLLFGSTFAAALIVLAYVLISGKVGVRRLSFYRSMKKIISERHAFFSTAGSSLYRSSSAVVLGFTSGITQVAYYSLSEKIVRVAQEMSRPVAMATYPRISSAIHETSEKFRPLFVQVLLIIGGVGLLSTCLLSTFSGEIVAVVLGRSAPDVAIVLRIMAFAPLIGSLNLILGAQVMHSFGFSREFSRFVAMSGLMSALVVVPATSNYGAKGAAATFVASELLLLANLVAFHLRRRVLA